MFILNDILLNGTKLTGTIENSESSKWEIMYFALGLHVVPIALNLKHSYKTILSMISCTIFGMSAYCTIFE